MKIVDEIKERVAQTDKGKAPYSPYVTLYNKLTGEKKVFPTIDATMALALPNCKWSQEPAKPAPTALSELIVAEATPEPIAEPAPAAESTTYIPKRNRKPSLESQE